MCKQLVAFPLFVVALLALSCQTAPAKAPDPANANYTIERQTVALVNGSFEQAAASGSASKIVTKLGEWRATGDVNGDSKPDVAVVLVQSPGGSGTFYYVAAVLGDGSETGAATNAVLVGDRVAVENVGIAGGKIVVDYLARVPNEPMTAKPTVKTSKKFAVKDGKLALAD